MCYVCTCARVYVRSRARVCVRAHTHARNNPCPGGRCKRVRVLQELLAFPRHPGLYRVTIRCRVTRGGEAGGNAGAARVPERRSPCWAVAVPCRTCAELLSPPPCSLRGDGMMIKILHQRAFLTVLLLGPRVLLPHVVLLLCGRLSIACVSSVIRAEPVMVVHACRMMAMVLNACALGPWGVTHGWGQGMRPPACSVFC